MQWGDTDAVVSIPSGPQQQQRRGTSGAASHQLPATPTSNSSVAAATPIRPQVSVADLMDDESVQTPLAQTARSANRRSTSLGASPAARALSPGSARSSSHKKARSSGGGVSTGRSRLLPPPPSSGYGTASYQPFSPSAQSASPLDAAFSGANAATQPSRLLQQQPVHSLDLPGPPTRYLGMQTPKTEWLLPTRVSVQERTTTTTQAKSNAKSPKADRTWRGYVPANQPAAFDLRVHHPRVLESPLPALPGAKNAQYDGVIQRVPVSEAATRASLGHRSEKNPRSSRGHTPSAALDEEMERRRAEKRARFALEMERAKADLWREAPDVTVRHQMLAEERSMVEEMRAKVRAARAEREARWRAEERETRARENQELRGPEARLAKYERWLRDEQEQEARKEYMRTHGEQPPPGYGRVEEEPREQEDEADEFGVLTEDDLDPDLAGVPVSLPMLQFVNGGVGGAIDHGRVVGSLAAGLGIEFKMTSSSDPEANAPLFTPEQAAAAVIVAAPAITPAAHINANNTVATAAVTANANAASFAAVPASPPPQHDRQPSSSHVGVSVVGGVGGHTRDHRSHGSLGGWSQSGDGASALLDQQADVDLEPSKSEPSAYDRKESSAGQRDAERDIAAITPEPSHVRRGPSVHSAQPSSQQQQGSIGVDHVSSTHAREASHSVPRVVGGLVADEDDVPLERSRTSHASHHVAHGDDSQNAQPSTHQEVSRGRRSDAIEEETRGALSNLAISPAAAEEEHVPAEPSAPMPPVEGDPVSWSHDESVLARGISVMKVPRGGGGGLFSSGPKRVQLFLARGTQSGPSFGKWLLHWDSRKKSKEEDFVNVSDLVAFHRGIDAGAFKGNKDLIKKFGDRATHCFTLDLPDRMLDIVVLSEFDCSVLSRVLARIVHPSGAHRTPRESPEDDDEDDDLDLEPEPFVPGSPATLRSPVRAIATRERDADADARQTASAAMSGVGPSPTPRSPSRNGLANVAGNSKALGVGGALGTRSLRREDSDSPPPSSPLSAADRGDHRHHSRSVSSRSQARRSAHGGHTHGTSTSNILSQLTGH